MAFHTVQRKPQPFVHRRLGPYTQAASLRNSVLQLDHPLHSSFPKFASEALDITPELQSLHTVRVSPPQEAAVKRNSLDNYPHLSFPKSELGALDVTPHLQSPQALRGSLPLEALGKRNPVDRSSRSSFPKSASGARDITPELISPPPLRGSPPRYSYFYNASSSLSTKAQVPQRLLTKPPLSQAETSPNQSVRLVSSFVFASEYPQPLQKSLFPGGPHIPLGLQEPEYPAPRQQRIVAVPGHGGIMISSINEKGQALQAPSTTVVAPSAGSGFMRMVKGLLMKLGPEKVCQQCFFGVTLYVSKFACISAVVASSFCHLHIFSWCLDSLDGCIIVSLCRTEIQYRDTVSLSLHRTAHSDTFRGPSITDLQALELLDMLHDALPMPAQASFNPMWKKS